MTSTLHLFAILHLVYFLTHVVLILNQISLLYPILQSF